MWFHVKGRYRSFQRDIRQVCIEKHAVLQFFTCDGAIISIPKSLFFEDEKSDFLVRLETLRHESRLRWNAPEWIKVGLTGIPPNGPTFTSLKRVRKRIKS